MLQGRQGCSAMTCDRRSPKGGAKATVMPGEKNEQHFSATHFELVALRCHVSDDTAIIWEDETSI